MNSDRKLTAIALVMLLLSVTLGAALFVEGDVSDESIEGDWNLAFYRSYDTYGNYSEWSSSGPYSSDVTFVVDSSIDGVITGTICGISFKGVVADTVFQIFLYMDSGYVEILGQIYTSGVLYPCIVSNLEDDMFTMLAMFTTDGSMACLSDFTSVEAVGSWESCEIYDSECEVQSLSLCVSSQNVTAFCGTMEFNDDGDDKSFCAILSMLQNGSMNVGFLLDEDGTPWIIMVKRGAFSMYSLDYTNEVFNDIQVSLTKDPGSVVIPVAEDISGTWVGTYGYNGDGTSIDISDMVFVVSDQEVCRVYGFLMSDTILEFEGIMCIMSPKIVEMELGEGDSILHALIMVDGNNLTILISDGSFEGLEVLEFKRVTE